MNVVLLFGEFLGSSIWGGFRARFLDGITEKSRCAVRRQSPEGFPRGISHSDPRGTPGGSPSPGLRWGCYPRVARVSWRYPMVTPWAYPRAACGVMPQHDLEPRGVSQHESVPGNPGGGDPGTPGGIPGGGGVSGGGPASRLCGFRGGKVLRQGSVAASPSWIY